jgi:hypothetical protein
MNAGLQVVPVWVVADAAGVGVVRWARADRVAPVVRSVLVDRAGLVVANMAAEVAAVRRGIASVNSWMSDRRALIVARSATSCSMP